MLRNRNDFIAESSLNDVLENSQCLHTFATNLTALSRQSGIFYSQCLSYTVGKNGQSKNFACTLCHHSLVILPSFGNCTRNFGNCTKSFGNCTNSMGKCTKSLVQLPELGTITNEWWHRLHCKICTLTNFFQQCMGSSTLQGYFVSITSYP